MSKLNFKDYSANYDELKDEEKKKSKELKKQKRLEEKNNRYKLNEDTMQQCLELKEYLEVLKNSVDAIDREEIRNNISKKIDVILRLKHNLLKKNHQYHILGSYTDNLKDVYGGFGLLLITALIITAILRFFIGLMIEVPLKFSLLGFIVIFIGVNCLDFLDYEPCLGKLIKIMIGSLPFNNRYSFIKTIQELEKLEIEYRNFSKQYEDYLKYLDNPEKSEVTENIIKGKEVKDLYLLEINKLVDKVKELPLGSDRDKYLNTIEKLTELYKREKERIILKNGRVHSEEEIELEMSVLKQIAYIEMELNNSLYKTKSTQLLSEDYLTTLNKLDSTKDKKLERTLSLGK